ncbi:hypothetical protein ACGFJT_37005 [Actinomadura geliboluensis]|uniref:hypothetical protein n=1 Tax=Actinomadura geliboluensis TaxID=882440 RepID=UPI0037214EBC
MITMHNKTTTDSERDRLAALIARWPVGLDVQHITGWAGRVVYDEPGRILGFGLGIEAHHAAHVLVGTAACNTAVCVERIQDGRPVTAWYRPAVLTPVGKTVPAVLTPVGKALPAPKPPKLAPKVQAPRGRRRTRGMRKAS